MADSESCLLGWRWDTDDDGDDSSSYIAFYIGLRVQVTHRVPRISPGYTSSFNFQDRPIDY